MATQTVVYTSTTRLSCAGCDEVPVILCVDSALVAQGECPITLEDTDFVYNHITGTLLETKEFNRCNTKYYQYTISYDDADLVSPNLLVCTDILGVVCEGCLTTFIRDTAGQEVRLEFLDGVYTLITQHGCRYEIASSGYNWTFTGDSGPVQTVNAGENVEYIGGDSISTTTLAGDQLTIDLDLSADVGNVLSLGTDNNIFLDCAAITSCIGSVVTASNGLYESGNDIRLGGTLSEPTTINATNFNLEVSLTGAGAFQVLQNSDIALIVDPATGYVGINEGSPLTPLHVTETTNAAGNEFIDVDTFEHVAQTPPVGFDFKGINDVYRLTNSGGSQYVAARISVLGIGAPGTEAAGLLINLADGTGTNPESFTSTTAVTVGKVAQQATLAIGATGGAGESGALVLNDANTNNITIQTSPVSTLGYTLTLPPDSGLNTQFLQTDGLGTTVWATPSFTLSADAGPAETVENGETLIIAGSGAITTTVSAPDTVTISVAAGADFSIPLVADSGTVETIVQGDTLTIIGSGAATTASSNFDTITIDVPTGANFSFTLAGDAGTPQTITQGNTVSILTGNGVSSVAGATDTVTITASLSSDAENSISFGTDNGLYSGDTFSGAISSGAGDAPAVDISGAATYGPYAVDNVVFNNPSTLKIAQIIVVTEAHADVDLDGAGTPQTFTFRRREQVNGGAVTSAFSHVYGGVAGGLRQTLTDTTTFVFNVAASASFTYDTYLEVITAGATSGVSTLNSLSLEVNILGVAV